MNPLVDSHCHLQSLAPDEAERALDEAREAGVRGFLVPALCLDDTDRLLELCARHDDVWCALGVHPHEAATWEDGDQLRLANLLDSPGVVAVGECGLDFHYDFATRAAQHRALLEQLQVAAAIDLPAVVHNRESNHEMLEMVARPELSELRAVFHSFAGGAEMARTLVARSFSFGLSGMITFRAAENVREVIPLLAPERVLVETDTPYLAPVPHRGEANRPAWVVHVARRLAEERGLTLDEVAETTTGAFSRLFSRAEPPPSRQAIAP